MTALQNNLAYGTVLTPPSPATSGTSLVLNSGEGGNFPTIVSPDISWVTLCPPGVPATMANAEIVKVTNRSSDTLTIVRAQRGTTAKSVASGWQVFLGIYVEDIARSESMVTGIFREALMNGNFDVWQWGTSGTLADITFTYLADRWFDVPDKNGGTLPTLTRSRQSLTPGDIPGSFYFSRLNTNGAGTSLGANSLHRLHQRIEHGTRFLGGDGNTITLSFYARSDIAGKKLGVSMSQRYGTGGFPSSSEQINGTNWTLTSSWVKYTHTFTLNTLAGKTFGTNNDDYLQLELNYMWGSSQASPVGAVGAETYVGSGNIDIAAASICFGSYPLPISPRSYDDVLLCCKRYYEVGRYQTSLLAGACTVGDYIECDVPYTVEKRSTGSVSLSDTSGNVGKISLRHANDSLTASITPTITLVSTRAFNVSAQSTATTQRGAIFNWSCNSEL